MRVNKVVNEIILEAYTYAKDNRDEYLTPEHILHAALSKDKLIEAISLCGGDVEDIKLNLQEYIDQYIDKVPDREPEQSYALQQLFYIATEQARHSENNIVSMEHIINAIFTLEESYASYYLEEQGVDKGSLLYHLCHNGSDEEEIISIQEETTEEEVKTSFLEKYSVNLTQLALREQSDPLIGREDIINRTIHILCRRTKNNPVHVGEPGVGKTAITLGIARLISEGKVPNKLKNAEIFSLDIGSMLAGTKYRGDFEERIKKVLDEVKTHENPIVYIDEIHNIVGAGALNGGALDASNLLKPYLMEGKVRFIGATTFDEYKKHFSKDKALSRRFQTIEIVEPSIKECIEILEGLKENYEKYHNVKYTKEALESAVNLSHKYINDRFLPDKAIDIIDEAGAFAAMNREKAEEAILIDEKIIEDTVSKVCRIPKQTVESNEVDSLKNLEGKLKENVFGQDKAVEEVVRCIKMSRAGLNDENKPVASMLFVGPTGVGKTEIAKSLANIMGSDLVRFDMSEYAEKHAASKLIGSPPGYVGYEEGGMLTDTIRKKPNCVLLLDEIEKAHSDILNVLLQVMDYATLTDNQGRKADFRNVIIIMTSNAGARNIGKNLVGFGDREIRGEAINDEVKRSFTPEFRNRLDKIVVFNHISDEMALDIVKKQLNNFKLKLQHKNVDMEFSDACVKHIAKIGTSREFGAREIIRIINSEMKPLLIDEILFGKLNKGGKCYIDVLDGKFTVDVK